MNYGENKVKKIKVGEQLDMFKHIYV